MQAMFESEWNPLYFSVSLYLSHAAARNFRNAVRLASALHQILQKFKANTEYRSYSGVPSRVRCHTARLGPVFS